MREAFEKLRNWSYSQDLATAARFLNLHQDPLLWDYATSHGLAPLDWQKTDLSQWVFVPGNFEKVESLWVKRTLVTVEEWRLWKYLPNRDTGDFSKENLPISLISWHQALDYCNTVSHHQGYAKEYLFSLGDEIAIRWHPSNGLRLPTWDEWTHLAGPAPTTECPELDPEKKCACNTGFKHYDWEKYAWTLSNSHGSTQEVKQKLPNQWGLFDIWGNVQEWCWSESAYEQKWCRGGSSWDLVPFGRDGVHSQVHPHLQDPSIGFRPVRMAQLKVVK